MDKARKTFLPLAGTYVLGTMNDNLFKQAALIMAVSMSMGHLQGWATSLFAAPFILLSAWSGWISDKLPKHRVVQGSKGLEVVAMGLGFAGMATMSWWLILSMVFLMGVQSTLFGPALNGSIPELYAAEDINRVGGVLKTVTTLGILAGIGSAGMLLDCCGPTGVGVACLSVAVVGFAVSLFIKGAGTPKTSVPFPKSGPLASVFHLRNAFSDRELALAIVCDTAFYTVASVGVLGINTLCLTMLGLGAAATSGMSVVMMAGICLGSVVAGNRTTPRRWRRLMPFACGGLALSMAGCLVAGNAWVAAAILFLGGFCGGLLVIPASGFIQHRPAADRKGEVIAASNFLAFLGIFLAGPVFTLALSVSPGSAIAAVAAMAFLFTIVITRLAWRAVKEENR